MLCGVNGRIQFLEPTYTKYTKVCLFCVKQLLNPDFSLFVVFNINLLAIMDVLTYGLFVCAAFVPTLIG